MDGNDHLIGLGKVIGNLTSVELLLRIFLCEANGEPLHFPDPSDTETSETHLTNYMALGAVVSAYNALLSATEQKYVVDSDIVKIRDALAHGRLASNSTSLPLTLYKFGRPSKGKVPVEQVVELTRDWLEEKRALLRAQMDKVQECSKGRGYKLLG